MDVRLTGGDERRLLHLQCVEFPLNGIALLTEFCNFRLARARLGCRLFADLIEQALVFRRRKHFALQIVNPLGKP